MSAKWFWSAALSCYVLSIGSIVMAMAVGDCTGIAPESNADCDNIAQCKTTNTCVAVTNPDPDVTAAYVVWTNSILKGNCYNGWWDNGCVNCATLVCASGVGYSSMDAYGQCSGFVQSIYWTCFNCCVG